MGFGLQFWFTDLVVGFRVWGLGFCFNGRGIGLGIWDFDFGLSFWFKV